MARTCPRSGSGSGKGVMDRIAFITIRLFSCRKPPKTFTQKAFYVIAYLNVVIVFCVLITIAYWRWGL